MSKKAARESVNVKQPKLKSRAFEIGENCRYFPMPKMDYLEKSSKEILQKGSIRRQYEGSKQGLSV